MKVMHLGASAVEGLSGVAMTLLLDETRIERIRVDVAQIDAGASLPRHQAGQLQRFYVVSGAGRVAGEGDVEVPVGPGSMAEWQKGEWHTSWADSAMTVLIVQSHTQRGG